jgi:hypothetical protein
MSYTGSEFSAMSILDKHPAFREQPVLGKFGLLRQAVLRSQSFARHRFRRDIDDPESLLERALIRLAETQTNDRLCSCIDLLIRLFDKGIHPEDTLSGFGGRPSYREGSIAALADDQFAAVIELTNKLVDQNTDPFDVLFHCVPFLVGLPSDDFAAALSFIGGLAADGDAPVYPLWLALRIRRIHSLAGPSFAVVLGHVRDFVVLLRTSPKHTSDTYGLFDIESLAVDRIGVALPSVARCIGLLQRDRYSETIWPSFPWDSRDALSMLSRVVAAIDHCSESLADFRENLLVAEELLMRLRQHDNVPATMSVDQLALVAVRIKKSRKDYEIIVRPALWHEEKQEMWYIGTPYPDIVTAIAYDDPGSVTLLSTGN